MVATARPRCPPPAAPRATLRWYASTHYAFITVRTVLRDDRPGASEVARPAFTTAELGGGWRVRKNVELRFNVDNLLDERYPSSVDPDAVLAPGRSLTLAIEGSFSR